MRCSLSDSLPCIRSIRLRANFNFPDGCRWNCQIAPLPTTCLSLGTARYDVSFHALVYPEDISVVLELNTDLWTQQTGLERIVSVTNLLYRAAESPGKRLSQLDGMMR